MLASRIFDFKKYKRLLVLGNCFMAFRARYLFMLPIKLEGRFIMIKVRYFPALRLMTSQAIGCAFVFKLSVMDILVTRRACGRKISEFLIFPACIIFPEMACPASLLRMCPLQIKACQGMIKTDAGPPRFIVAMLTTGFRIKFLTDKGFVDILVAIDATGPYIPKAPLVLFFMAGNAGCGKMSSFQLKRSGIVLFNSKGRTRKSFCGMASRAISYHTPVCELTLMVILVAVGATVMPERVGKIGFVA